MGRMINLKEIISGWKNDLFPAENMKGIIDAAYKERIAICRGCEYNNKVAKEAGTYKGIRKDEHCLKCGCPLQKKTKCLSCECPLQKWMAVITEAEEDDIFNRQKNEDGKAN